MEKARIDKVLANNEIKTLITAIGGGFGDDDFDITKLRYHKIILMTDADVDGSHIRTLLLTFFFRQMRQLVEEKYVYIAQPPLYRIKQGKDFFYAYDETERENITKRLMASGKKVDLSRYKGLGEMNPEQLWSTTMDPEMRTIKQVTVEDATAADHLFSVLMGENIEPRRNFIKKNAKYVRNLDI